jgi:O-acetyl-ADP-ribose deacetylase (regulator of RNase III)
MIRVAIGDPMDTGTECVLRSVSSELEPDTPGSRDIGLAAGPEVLGRLQSMGSLPVGAAVITPGGGLPSAFVIHVVLQSQEERVRTETVRLALQNGLRRAEEWGLESLGLPPLGTGAGNLDAEEAAEVMVPLLREHLRRFDHPREVVISVGNDYEHDVFLRAVERSESRASTSEG